MPLSTKLTTFLAIAISLALFSFFAGNAHAAVFMVNDERDASDLNVQAGQAANGACDSSADAGTQCTLRAALDEANATAAADTIVFDGFVNGKTLNLDAARGAAGATLRITQPVTIDACRNVANPTGPCFGVRAPGHTVNGDWVVAMAVGAPDVSIDGLAVHNAGQGIFVGGASPRFLLRASYVGLSLTGIPSGNDIGMTVVGDDAVVGGVGIRTGNVISANNAGIEVFAADRAKIAGNLIGTDPAGDVPRPNGVGVKVVGPPDNRATSTVIGGALSAEAEATPACDGACNVIAGRSAAIDLNRNTPAGTAAAQTTIAGNHIGVNRAGAAALVGSTAIDVGDAGATTIGGGSAASRNVIAANLTTIGADRAPADLVIQENYIGTNSAGSAPLGTGVVTLTSPSVDPLVFRANLVAILHSFGLRILGRGAQISSNYVGIGPTGQNLNLGGGSDGIRIEGGAGVVTEDNDLTQNVIGNAGRAGVAIVGASRNHLFSNRIGSPPDGSDQGNGAYGVLIDHAANGVRANANVIGSDDGALANLISNNPKAAIAIRSENNANFVGAVHGINRAAAGRPEPEFIDLGDDGYGNDPNLGPASGIQAPRIVIAGPEWIVGTGTPGATVRVYEKTSPERGELGARVDAPPPEVGEDGVWAMRVVGAMELGTLLAATQTASGDLGGTSELSEPGLVSGAPAGGPAPETAISGPQVTNDRTPEFELSSNQDPVGYLCRVTPSPDQQWEPCFASYQSSREFADGSYTVAARAVNGNGSIDQTPALHNFMVDTVAPSAPAITGGPSGETDDPRPAFTFRGDAQATFACRIDGAPPAPCSNEFRPASALAGGRHTFSVTQTDAAGNVSPAATREFVVRGKGARPNTEIVKGPKRKIKTRGKAKAKVKFVFRASTAGAKFVCSLDGKPPKPCKSPLKLRVKPGKHRFEVAAVGPDGADETPASHRFKVVR